MKEPFEFEIKNGKCGLKKYLGDQRIVNKIEQREKEIEYIASYAFAENRNIEEVILPDSILQIGRHAFYNCRNLKKLSVPARIKDIEDGAFKNCERLKEIELRKAESGKLCLKHLLYEQNQKLWVKIYYCKKWQGVDMAYLFFPGFEYEYIANEPARIFNEVGYGAGYLYQQCFFDGDVDYKRYDSIFTSACVSETMETLAGIALMRLGYPYGLEIEAKQRYYHYIIKNLIPISIWILKKEDREQLFLLEQLGVFTNESLLELIEKVRSQHLMKGLAWLLDYHKTHFGRKENHFEL